MRADQGMRLRQSQGPSVAADETEVRSFAAIAMIPGFPQRATMQPPITRSTV